MVIQQKLGNINDNEQERQIDWLELEWFETDKRILHKKTRSGKSITLKFLQENQRLRQGDILYEDAGTIVAVDILPCECLVVKPNTMLEMASVCYEIGNKHTALYYEEGELLIPFELPLFNLLKSLGVEVRKGTRRLLYPLRTSVIGHKHKDTETLFSKIMKLST